MTAPDNLPPSYINWSNTQLVTWIEGLGTFVQSYLPSFRTSGLTGRRLSCLTESDLKSLGITKIGDLRRLQIAISGLIDDFTGLEVENLQSLLFNVIRVTDQFTALLKCIRSQDSSFESMIEFEHLLVKCLLRLGSMVKKAASWLERGPFSHFSRLSSLRGTVLQHTVDLNTVLQSALRNSSLAAYQNAMLELTSELKDRLEVVIHDCDDSILLTPCSVEYVSLRKDEQATYGFTFYTNEFNVHIIKSLDSNLQAPAFTCGAIAKDDEIVEVNYQLVLGWEHNAVVRLIQQSTHRLDLRIRKRPSQCSDYSLASQRHRMHALTKSLRPFTAEPQHSRRSDFIRNRTPKRRTQPLPSVSPNTSTASTGTTTTNISHEEKEEESLVAEVPEVYEKSSRQSLHQSESLKSPTTLSRTHSRPRHERYCQALQPSLLILSSSNEDRIPNTESSVSSLSPMESRGETSISHRKNRRRPVTLGSLDDFAKTSNTILASSTPPPNLSLSKLQTNSQGWLWLKKRTSTSFGNRYAKRWCVFKHNALYYYRNQEEENAEGLILLHGFTISPVSNESGRSGKYPFRVYNEWTRFVFAADSERARTRWMNMLGLAAIGQSACLWTSPIGGFHPGYLPSSTKVEEKEVAIVSSPRLLEPPRPNTSGGENSLRRQPVTIHRCSSSLNVPSSSGLHQPPIDAVSVSNRQLDQHSGHNHHHYLSVSATCLAANDSAAESSDEESEISSSRKQHLASEVIQVKSEEGEETNEEQNANQSPCRLTRRAAMIRRRRIRRLTEGSISPSVFLTSPPMVIRGQNYSVSSEWKYLSSETVVVEGGKSLEQRQCRHNLTLHSTGTSSCGDEGDSGESLQLLVQNPNRLSPSFSLSSRSSESPEQNSS
nr:pdz domain containing protein [Hymenolepis microstoma]